MDADGIFLSEQEEGCANEVVMDGGFGERGGFCHRGTEAQSFFTEDGGKVRGIAFEFCDPYAAIAFAKTKECTMKTIARRHSMAILCRFLLVAGCAAPAIWFSSQEKVWADDGSAMSSADQIQTDFKAAEGDFSTIVSSVEVLVDANSRRSLAPKLIPVIKRMKSDMQQLTQVAPEKAKSQSFAVRQVELNAFLVLLDDGQTTTKMQDAAKGDGDDSTNAQCALLVAAWLRNAHDGEAQEKLLGSFETLAKAHPTSDSVALAGGLMWQAGSADARLRAALGDLITSNLKGRFAQLDINDIVADRNLHTIANKPLVVSGTQPDGKEFSTADWKGKVILVDFWATWCGPCKEELPRVIKAYNEFHGEGLEVVGVSNDFSAKDLTEFIAQSSVPMSWPELFDAKAAANHTWNAVTVGFGIQSIPTVFLIDKNGICRSIDAGDDFEKQIAKLLAEPSK